MTLGMPNLERACSRWLERPASQFGTALVVGFIIAVGSATQLYVNWSMNDLTADFSSLFVQKAVEWSLWAAAVPLVVQIDRRTDWSGNWMRPVVLHLTIATGVFLIINLPSTALLKLGRDAPLFGDFWNRYVFRIGYRMPSSWVVYAGILGFVKLLEAFVRSRRLDRDLARAQLQVLREQLQPHFLFNTLHTAASLVRAGDRAGAVDTLAALGDLLRRSLRHGREEEVTLAEEVAFLEHYLEIHRKRFSEHLAVEIEVDPELLDRTVPPFLLQPLVENAVRHGLDLETDPGEVRVVAERVGEELHLRVEDSGGTFHGIPTREERNGMGLTNLERRLATMYGNRATLSAGVVRGRSVVTVTLPMAELDV